MAPRAVGHEHEGDMVVTASLVLRGQANCLGIVEGSRLGILIHVCYCHAHAMIALLTKRPQLALRIIWLEISVVFSLFLGW